MVFVAPQHRTGETSSCLVLFFLHSHVCMMFFCNLVGTVFWEGGARFWACFLVEGSGRVEGLGLGATKPLWRGRLQIMLQEDSGLIVFGPKLT